MNMRFLSIPAFLFSLLCSYPAVEAQTGKKWLDMNYGPYFSGSVEAPGPGRNLTYKGLVLRVDGNWTSAAGSADSATMLFDTDLLRFSAGWTGGLLNMRNIAWDGSHGTHSTMKGSPVFLNPLQPGWGKPEDGSFKDPRELPYGPLPRKWAHFKGLYLNKDQVVLSYSVGKANLLELASFRAIAGGKEMSRTLNIQGADRDLLLLACDRGNQPLALLDRGSLKEGKGPASSTLALLGQVPGKGADEAGEITLVSLSAQGKALAATWQPEGTQLRLKISPAKAKGAGRLKLSIWKGPAASLRKYADALKASAAPADLGPLTKGGPARWKEKLETEYRPGPDRGGFAIDVLSVPMNNPWKSWMRLGGFDFFADGRRAAACTWMGDVWLVDGLGQKAGKLTWQRIATGLFQPLGLKIVDEAIYVLGRDQITILRDLNGDGEADYYENFNNDAECTEHFHEFAMDLQTDAKGNFYYTKGGRHAKDSVVPQHGSIIRVSKDGSKTDIVANGFRAPNGLCVNPDGSFITSDQEGHWTPANRINWVKPGGFYGYMWSFHRGKKPTTYDPPLCWLHKRYDRSPAEQLWVPKGSWGPLGGKLLSLSYGTGSISHILHEEVGGLMQGGAIKLNLPIFPTGIMRGRFHPGDGHLYLCGLFGWAGNRTQAGGLYRIRHTGKPLHLPLDLHATSKGMVLTFSDPLDKEKAAKAGSYSIERWNYRWQQRYGSPDYKLSDGKIGRDRVAVKSATVSKDGKSVFLEIEDMKPCMQMLIRYRLSGSDGAKVSQEIYNTIHKLGDHAKVAPLFN